MASRTDLSIAIQHVPDRADRREWVREIVAQIRCESPQTPVEIIEDRERAGPWSTHRRALACCAAPHHLVLQDDIQLCRDFVSSARAAISARPDDLICPYNHSEAALRAKEGGIAWMRTQVVWGPAIIWPQALIGLFLEWEAAHIDPAFEDDDLRVSIWLHKENRHAFATAPSLVQHLGVHSVVVHDSDLRRTSKWFIGAGGSGIEIDWKRDLDRCVDVHDFRIKDGVWRYYRE